MTERFEECEGCKDYVKGECQCDPETWNPDNCYQTPKESVNDE